MFPRAFLKNHAYGCLSLAMISAIRRLAWLFLVRFMRRVRRVRRQLLVALVRLLKRRPSHQRLGRKGEQLACRVLEELGCDILERNYRGRYGGEVDIIARDGATVCFVEVKTRHRMKLGRPADAVDGNRRHRQLRAGDWYCHQLAPEGELKHRFDIMEVIFDGWRLSEITYIQNAYQRQRKAGNREYGADAI